MGLTSSLYIGVSGLSASSEEISVVGDNIANVNTVGFKAGRAAFEDSLAQQLVGGRGQVGVGARIQSVQRILTQGSLLNTGVSTDLALQGSGYFVVNGASDGRAGNFYTRAGAFTLSKDGYLTNLEGLRLQGFQATPAGALTQQIGDLQAGSSTAPPLPTANIAIRANLQSDAVIPAAFDPADPNATSNFATSVTVYDSIGAAHQVDVYFARTGDGTWDYHALTDGGGLSGGVAGTATEVASGSMVFDASGRLTAETQTSDFNPLNAVGPQALAFNVGDPTGGGGTGLAGITQYASESAVTFQTQDGYSAGSLSDVQIDASGRVVGAFTNGQTRVLGQVVVADFKAADKLERRGSNLFVESPDSGQPLIGAPAEGGRGGIAAGSLEQSNVDMAAEFVRMIAAQRAFQANSKTITTADQLLNELIQLKR